MLPLPIMRLVASTTFFLAPSVYYVIKAGAYRGHQRYRELVQDEPGVKWEDSKHKRALEQVYRF